MDALGRDEEMALLAARLRDRRLVTVVGPGGIGKTTLARTAAERAAQDFDEGSLTVDMTLVDDHEGVRESLAGQLGYASGRAMLQTPGDRPVLIVVDNCEHVLDEVADAVDQLLGSCEMPTVLATSRSPLELPGEVVVALGGLAVPPPGALDAPAVQVFVERARDAGVDLEPDEAIAELCRRLDGVPLALELAAARTRTMAPAEILRALDVGIEVLAPPRRRGTARHRSLRAAIDWSYDLLDPPHRRLVAGLAVFAGPFSVDAAHAVAGDPEGRADDTAEGLAALVDASMVMAEHADGATRFRLLETIRAHGAEVLDATGARTHHERRLVDHTIERATRILREGASGWSSSALTELLDAYGDLAAAVRWCVAHDEDPDRALLLVAVLWGVVHQAHTEEVGRLAQQVLERWPATDAPLRADAVATAATCRYMLGDLDGAVAMAEAELDVGRPSPFAPATLRRVVAQARRAAGDAEGAVEAFAATAATARSLGLVAMATEADAARAQVIADLGRVEEALDLARGAEEEARRHGSEVGVTWARAIQGSILLRSDVDAAATLLDRVLGEAHAIRYHAAASVVLRARALADVLRRDCPGAAARTLQMLEDLLAVGATDEMRAVLEVAAPTLELAGRTQVARDLAATALVLPVVSITASVGHELVPLQPGDGRILPVRDAIVIVRQELRVLLEPEGWDGVERRASATRRGTFRPDGDMWEVGLGDRTWRVRGTKGMHDIWRLLGSPSREVHSLELVGSAVDEAGTGPRLDETARRAYEQRVRELQADIDEADDRHDLARAERARLELDALVDELTSSLGLGGRARSSGSSAERARSTVTQRIRAAVRRIEAVDPGLARHLRASVRTGAFCCYEPEEPVAWVRGAPTQGTWAVCVRSP
ncbi:ATP-binding protein [Actinomarinicola tropica]|uniref:AAA+ ATPase domain-containing protein n=1 Tax=Actinomarinicola tropica TaxID=2789776 RepID=A0A5Q2RN71_9ACTN|nr:hypothetical protein [Actinomarinicola tropica]QGG96031.1 hypothetical protein GH723_13500 [Actinomarinicola tropica]